MLTAFATAHSIHNRIFSASEAGMAIGRKRFVRAEIERMMSSNLTIFSVYSMGPGAAVLSGNARTHAHRCTHLHCVHFIHSTLKSNVSRLPAPALSPRTTRDKMEP